MTRPFANIASKWLTFQIRKQAWFFENPEQSLKLFMNICTRDHIRKGTRILLAVDRRQVTGRLLREDD